MSTPEHTRYPHFINGIKSEPTNGAYLDVVDPSTGQVHCKTADGCEADVQNAVSAANLAFSNPAWREMSKAHRSQVLYQLGNIVLANGAELAELESRSSGGTITRVSGLDIIAVADLFFVLAEAIKDYSFSEFLPPRLIPEQVHTTVLREPLGVCAAITAWNFPILLLSWKIAPALAAGNTVVVKASELTPQTTFRLAELFSEILPPGVFNVVSGRGETVGEALVTHPNIAKVSFTGSTATGKHIQRTAADTLKRVTLELGGKGAAIVMPDANLELAAHGALFGIMMNSGQACEAASRLLVHEAVHDVLIERMVDLARKITIGNPLDPDTAMGPLISKAQFDKVAAFIDSAKGAGASVAFGGKRQVVSGFENGYFMQPTIITGSTNSMTHACEEIFGPVVSVIRFGDDDDPVAIANDSRYGLSAGIFTENVVRAQGMARNLQAGSVWINDWHMMRTDAPFGGYKESGYGREMGAHSIDSYTQIKSVSTGFEREPARKLPHHFIHKF